MEEALGFLTLICWQTGLPFFFRSRSPVLETISQVWISKRFVVCPVNRYKVLGQSSHLGTGETVRVLVLRLVGSANTSTAYVVYWFGCSAPAEKAHIFVFNYCRQCCRLRAILVAESWSVNILFACRQSKMKYQWGQNVSRFSEQVIIPHLANRNLFLHKNMTLKCSLMLLQSERR